MASTKRCCGGEGKHETYCKFYPLTKHDPKNKDCGLNHDFYSMCEPNCKGHTCTCVPYSCDQEEMVNSQKCKVGHADGMCYCLDEMVKEDWEDADQLSNRIAGWHYNEEGYKECSIFIHSLLSQARADERKKILGKVKSEWKFAKSRKKNYTVHEWKVFEEGYISAMKKISSHLLEELK